MNIKSVIILFLVSFLISLKSCNIKYIKLNITMITINITLMALNSLMQKMSLTIIINVILINQNLKKYALTS